MFHDNPDDPAIRACINARFSLIAVACKRYPVFDKFTCWLISGTINVYVAKDYSGNIPFSHRILNPQKASTSFITQMMYSPDGYALFVASEQGWYLWSVYGHLLAASNMFDKSQLSAPPLVNGPRSYEGYMHGVLDCCWGWSGLSVILLGHDSRLLYSLPLTRSSVTSCYNPVLPSSSYVLKFRIPSHNQYCKPKIAFYCIEEYDRAL